MSKAHVHTVDWEYSKATPRSPWPTCSYCGSMSPSFFIEQLTAGTAPEGTDWKYGWPHKFYMRVPNPHPDQLFVQMAKHGQDMLATDDDVAMADLTKPQLAILRQEGWRDEDIYQPPTPEQVRKGEHGREFRTDVLVQFATRTQLHGKFYSVHLADPDFDFEAHRELVNERTGIYWLKKEDGRLFWSLVDHTPDDAERTGPLAGRTENGVDTELM